MGIYENKLMERFQSFDQDGDGVVTRRDFAVMADRILAEFHVDRATQQARDLLAGADRYWVGLADIADADGDGQISATEFVAAANERLRANPAGFAEVITPWAEAVVRIADTNGDGQVEIPEWARMLVAMGVSPQRAPLAAEQLDRDEDGIITVRELLDSAVEFYTTEAPSRDFAVSR